MNIILMDMWKEYKLHRLKIIVNSLKKNHLLPIQPPNNFEGDEDSHMHVMQTGRVKTSEYIDTVYKKIS